MTVPPAAVERLRADLAVALDRAVTIDDIIALAVSGGPDSMALLALAAAAWPGQVIAATVDHGLRAEAAGEAAMVATWCASHDASTPSSPAKAGAQSRDADNGEQCQPTTAASTGPRPAPGNGLPHATLRPAKRLPKANLQAAARIARYELLADWATSHGATMLLTAHHADDQAETFLMRAARGSGLAGLSGIRPRRDIVSRTYRPGYPAGGIAAVCDERTIPLIRPLLNWRRSDLCDIVATAAIPFVDDPSNSDEHYDRTRFRGLLSENSWLDPINLAETSRYAREGHEALEAMIDWLWQERRVVRPDVEHCDHQTWLDLAGLPREIVRRLARAAIDSVRTVNGIVRPAFTTATNIEPLLDAVTAGTAATQAGILVSRRGDNWHFREAPPRRETARTHS